MRECKIHETDGKKNSNQFYLLIKTKVSCCKHDNTRTRRADICPFIGFMGSKEHESVARQHAIVDYRLVVSPGSVNTVVEMFSV